MPEEKTAATQPERPGGEKRQHFVAKPGVVRLANGVAVVSGLFCLVVSTLLIANYLQIQAFEPLDSPELLELRAQLAEAPDAEAELVERIRGLDLLARKAFFTSQAHLRIGGYLLFAGVVVLLVALKVSARWSRRLPEPAAEAPDGRHWAEQGRSRELVAFASVVLVTAALLAAYFTPLDIPAATAEVDEVDEVDAAAAAAAARDGGTAFPDWDAVQVQWPCFRGPGGYGVARFDTAPTDWDGASGKNTRWKTEVPLTGFSSPVVWDEHVFLTGATREKRVVYCFGADGGELLWERSLPVFSGTPAEPPRVSEDTGYAAPTMVVHGDLAYAIFGTGDLVAYDFAGERRWGRNVGVPDNHYGHSSSLIAFEDLLFVQFDDKAKPRVMALNAATGDEVWTAARKKISWASPALIPVSGGVQLILNSEVDVDAYAPKTGKLLWSVKALDGEVAPSPAFGGNTVFVANDYAFGSAIRVEGAGDAPTAELAWQYDEYLPDVSSPVGTATHFYFATSMGDLVCLDAGTGEEAWVEELDEGFYSSPIVVGERIYALDLEGVMHIFAAGPEFKLVASPELGEATVATPAYLDGRIYLRSEKHLFCIEATS